MAFAIVRSAPLREKSALALRDLKRFYAELTGELSRIKAPPKRLRRLQRDREKYESEGPARREREKYIEGSLPHLAHVIKMYDPSWDPSQVRPIRKVVDRSTLPHGTIAAAAMDILRESKGAYFSMAEIVSIIGEQYGIDLSTVEARQKFHTAVNNALMKTHKDFLVSDDGRPKKWALREETEPDIGKS
jgi:hypothetical protein